MDPDVVEKAEVEFCETSDDNEVRSPVHMRSSGKQSTIVHTPNAYGDTCVGNVEKVLDLNLENEIPTIANSTRVPHRSPDQVLLHSARNEALVEGSPSPSLKLNPAQSEDVQDWRKFFHSGKSLGALQYFAPSRVNGKIIVKSPKEAIDEGIF